VNAVNNPSKALPAGWTTKTVQPSAARTAAGFSIAVPPGWTEQRSGLAWIFDSPNGMRLDVDLTAHKYQNMVSEANYVMKSSLETSSVPGYTQVHLGEVPIRDTQGAIWQFTWTPQGGVKQWTDDMLFILNTSSGPQSYALYIRGPNSGWQSTYLPVLEKILKTFEPIPPQTVPAPPRKVLPGR
jgi:hypothetical protein